MAASKKKPAKTAVADCSSNVQRSKWLRCPFCPYTAFSDIDVGNLSVVPLQSRKRKSTQLLNVTNGPSQLNEAFEWSQQSTVGVAALLAHLNATHSHFTYDSVVSTENLSLHVVVRRKHRDEITAIPGGRQKKKSHADNHNEIQVKEERSINITESHASKALRKIDRSSSPGTRNAPICLIDEEDMDIEVEFFDKKSSSASSGSVFDSVIDSSTMETIFFRPRKKKKSSKANQVHMSHDLNARIFDVVSTVMRWPLSVNNLDIASPDVSVALATKSRYTQGNSNGNENSLFNGDGTLRVELLTTRSREIACFHSDGPMPQLSREYYHRSGLPYKRRQNLEHLNALLKLESRRNKKGSCTLSSSSLGDIQTAGLSHSTSNEDLLKPACVGEEATVIYSYDSEDDDPKLIHPQIVIGDAELSEFSDVMDEEKIFMSLWNTHARSFPPYSDAYLPFAIEVFAKRYAPVIVAKKLRFTFLVFLMYLWDVSLIRAEQVAQYIGIVDSVQEKSLLANEEVKISTTSSSSRSNRDIVS